MRLAFSHAAVCLGILAVSGASLAVASRGPTNAASPPATTDPILETFADSLVTYLPQSSTRVQDVRPQAGQRGVNLEGSLRAAPSFMMHIQGNPFEDAWNPQQNNGMRLDMGTYTLQDVDIAIPSKGVPWVIGRTFNARQLGSGGVHHDSSAYQGYNWFQSSQPEIVLYEHATDDAKDMVYLVYGADRYVEFKRTSSTATTFKATNGEAGVFSYVNGGTGDPDTYTLTDQEGYKFKFFGIDDDSGAAQRQLWTIEDPAGNLAYVGSTDDSTAISNGYDTAGRIKEAYDASGHKFTYTYQTLDSVVRLTKVESTEGATLLAKVEYSYYLSSETSEDDYGLAGDLKVVKITTPLSDSNIELVRRKYYRYWTTDTAPGRKHTIKGVVDFEGCRQFDYADDSTFDEDYRWATDTALGPYAVAYLEYDNTYSVTEASISGDCGCSGGDSGTETYRYETNASWGTIDTPGYDNVWKTRTILQRPDTSWVTQYFDEVGQPFSRLITTADPAGSGFSKWVTGVIRDSNGCVSEVRTPENCSAYAHSTGTITPSTTAGLIWVITRATTGATKSFMTERRWKKGTNGTANFDLEWAYGQFNRGLPEAGNQETHVIRPTVTTVHRYDVVTTDTANRITTTYTHSDYQDTGTPVRSLLALKKTVVTHPVVPTSENGSNSAATASRFFNKDGTLAFDIREDSVVEYREYTDKQMTKLVEDAASADFSTSGTDVPSGEWPSVSGTPIRRTTTFTYSGGSHDSTSHQDGRVEKSYYSELKDERLVILRYADYDGNETPKKYWGPVDYSVRGHDGKLSSSAVIGLTNDQSTTTQTSHVTETVEYPNEAVSSLGTVSKWMTYIYDEPGSKLEQTRTYSVVPASGLGTENTNFDTTSFNYDSMGRRDRIVEMSGTIRRMSYDLRGLMETTWIGTSDTSWTPSAGGGDMVKVGATTYDGGNDDGNGYVTKLTEFLDDSGTNKREVTLTNDLRGNVLLEAHPVAPHLFHKYDNQNRRVATGYYSSTSAITDPPGQDPLTLATNRLALMETKFDKRERVWRSVEHKVDAADGSDDDTLNSDSWFDSVGRLVKTDGDELSKTFYDALGRQTQYFILAKDNDSSYGDVATVTGDTVLEQHSTGYDTDNDDVVLQVAIERYHDSTGTGLLDSGADGSVLKVTSGDLLGRAQITASWYDDRGRLTDSVEYGTNGGSTFDRGATSTPPARSDSALRTTWAYAKDGEVSDVTDPRSNIGHYDYDSAGRSTKEVKNSNGGSPTAPDVNQTVAYTYADGLMTALTAVMPSSPTNDQTTAYTYGTTKGTATGDSKIGTKHLLREVTYPDSSGSTDKVKLAYNAVEELVWKQDQGGNVFTLDYDGRGRMTDERVTTLGSGFDGAVRRIGTTYDSLGRRQLVTQYSASSGGSVTDEVKYSYDGWSNLTNFEQDRDSAVGASGSVNDYEVSYAYFKATTGRNTVRRNTLTLPSTDFVSINYGALGGTDDSASRVQSLKWGVITTVATYEYLGASRVVETNYPQPGITRKQYGSTSGSYPDLDSFDRVVKSRWTRSTATPFDFFSLDVTYDRNSNVTRVEDNVHAGFDVAYTNDGLDRLTKAEEGTWSGSSITSKTREQEWTLDLAGNWSREKLNLNSDTDYTDANEHDDTRTHNKVNQLTDRNTDSAGSPEYANIAYDAVGSLTDDKESYKYVYDAFGRLRVIRNQSNADVSEFTYNGLGFIKGVHQDNTATFGVLDGSDIWYYPAYDEAWRQVATFRHDDSSPKEEFVNHLAGDDGFGTASYINAVVCRNKDANTAWTSACDGTREERYYYCANWREDVSVLVKSDKKLAEWVKYSSYGVPFGLPRGDTDSDGDADSADRTQIATWRNAVPPIWNALGDTDLDGDVDAQDETNASDLSIGLGVLSSQSNNRGYGAYWIVLAGLDYARVRVLNAIHGSWTTRDPSGYKDSWNSYQYVSGTPLSSVDPYGRYRIAAPGIPDQDPNKQQRPISDADCCELAFGTKTSPLNSQYVGLIVCCNGIATICINPWLINGTPTSFEGQFYQCVYAHEKYHKDHHSPDCFGTPDGESPPSTTGQELEALRATQGCIEKIDCSADPSCDKKKEKRLEKNLRKQRRLTDPEGERVLDELRKLGPVG